MQHDVQKISASWDNVDRPVVECRLGMYRIWVQISRTAKKKKAGLRGGERETQGTRMDAERMDSAAFYFQIRDVRIGKSHANIPN